MSVTDTLGRPVRDLRISVTDRCNFRCVYCMPQEVFGHDYRFLPRRELLTFEEIEQVARVFVELGVQKLRITGGEPLLRRDLEVLVARLAALGDLEVPRGATVWGALLVTGIFAGALGYLIATWVQGRTTAARAALVFTLEAPFAALAGVLLADEILGWAGWLGCAVMMVAILVAEPAAAATLRRLASLTVSPGGR